SPNVIPTFTDGPGRPTLCFRAIRKITPGEEICHSYVELTLPSWKRRDILQRDYEFLCQCERCGAKDGKPRVGSEDWRMVQGAKNRLVLIDPDLCGTADICPFDGVYQQQPSAALRRACDRLYEGELVECESRADFEKLEKAIIQP
ncbi:Zinc finger MYND domain-containing protein 15, partial [Perkinsus olseni]